MNILIDTDGSRNAAFRRRFGVEGMVEVTVRYLRSKRISKIIINDLAVSCTDQGFHQLALMVSDAKQVLDNVADSYTNKIQMVKGSKVDVTC